MFWKTRRDPAPFALKERTRTVAYLPGAGKRESLEDDEDSAELNPVIVFKIEAR